MSGADSIAYVKMPPPIDHDSAGFSDIRGPNHVKSISVVIPAYCSSNSLPVLVERLSSVLMALVVDHEIIVLDDGSPDDTWNVLKELKSTYSRLKIVRLLKNSGQHNALLCGLSLARGDVVVTMDDDLQHSPEDIPALVAAIESGYDLAIASYEDKKHAAGRNVGGKLVDSLQRRVFGLPPDFQLTSFRAVRKPVVERVAGMGGEFPYITAMLLSHASRCVNVPVQHHERPFGRSNYGFLRSLKLAFNLILSYSSYPLYFGVLLLLCSLAFTVGLGSVIVWMGLVESDSMPGWLGIVMAISCFNVLFLFVLVMQGLYLSRMYRQLTRSRAGFTIGEIHE
ncbi:Glycosyltransferase involved in cell wall biosynthesis OS=Castellaniella defragrans OX=75697 GN=HNR28_000675 PE=4 SV=1 [Castellaniella defragrans]